MTGARSIGELAIAESDPSAPTVIPPSALFDWFSTVISQYANSPILLALIESTNDAIDPTPLFDAFYQLIWNIDTAQGYGLDVWGRIVGVGRVLQVPIGGFLGFEEDSGAETFGSGVFYAGIGLTGNFALSDTVYRRLILAKAMANITDGGTQSFNALLILLFPGYGNARVVDNENMTITLTFDSALSPTDRAIISQSGVLPVPAGVSFTIVD